MHSTVKYSNYTQQSFSNVRLTAHVSCKTNGYVIMLSQSVQNHEDSDLNHKVCFLVGDIRHFF